MFKNLILSIYIVIIFYFIFEYSRNIWFALITSSLILTAAPLYQSMIWSLEMEIVSQFLMFIVFLIFFKTYYSNFSGRKMYLYQILLFFLFITAFKSKPSCSVVPPILFSFVLISNYKKLRDFWLLLSIMFTIVVLPKFLSPSFYYHQPFKAEQITSFLEQTQIVFGFPLIFMALGSIFTIIYRSISMNVRLPSNQKDIIIFFGLWTFFTMCLWPILPSSETRYLTQALIPMALLICTGIYFASSQLKQKSVKIICFSVLFTLCMFQIKENVYLNMQYRGFWGSFFIAREKTYKYIEENYSNSLICYTFSWREIFYPYENNGNDWIWINSLNKKLPVIVKEKNMAIYRDGNIKAEKYNHIFWVFPFQSEIAGDYLKVISGDNNTAFDYLAKWGGTDIHEINLMTMELSNEGNYYPIKFYIMQVK